MVLGDPPPRLVAALDEESEKNRAAVVEALAFFNRGLPPLIASLAKSADGAAAPVRADYLKLLSRVRPPNFSGDAVPGLISACLRKCRDCVRRRERPDRVSGCGALG